MGIFYKEYFIADKLQESWPKDVEIPEEEKEQEKRIESKQRKLI